MSKSMENEQKIQDESKQSTDAPAIVAPVEAPGKKTRAPFVWTEKRAAAFEEVKRKRIENIARRKVEAAAQLEAEKREKMERAAAAKVGVPERPTQAVEMAIATTAPNVMPEPLQLSEPANNAADMVAEDDIEQSEMEDDNTSFVAEVPILQNYEAEGGVGITQNQNLKRKHVESEYMDVADPSELSDDELIRLMSEAREAAERRGLVLLNEQRRDQGKAGRPDYAFGFLEHAYQFSARGQHPSQLRSATGNPKDFVWL
jgi:hypothetical protein